MTLTAEPMDRSAVLERGTSALVAAAIGDALGWPCERNNQRIRPQGVEQHGSARGGFQDWTRKVGGRYYASEEPVLAGEYSDDTQLLIATARALYTAGDEWFDHLARAELPAWLIYERGGGRATKQAARSWSRGLPPWEARDHAFVRRYYEAGGNGVAMRILSHAVADVSDPHKLRRDVLMNGIATHGHPRALAAALVYAVALRAALVKEGQWQLGELIDAVDASELWHNPPEDSEMPSQWIGRASRHLSAEYGAIWHQTVREIVEQLRTAREGLQRGGLAIDKEILGRIGAFGEQSGAGTVTSVCAIFLAARYAASPATGVRTAAYTLGADTDTMASMTAALLGAMLGDSWIPTTWHDVQDVAFLRRLIPSLARAEELARDAPSLLHPSKPWTDRDAKRLRSLLQETNDDRIAFGPLGSVERVGAEPLLTRVRNLSATRWHLRTEAGQTIYVTLFRKEPLPPPEPTEEQVRKNEGPPDRALAQVTALADAVGSSLTAADLLHVLEAIMMKIRDTAGPMGDQAQLPAKTDIRSWLQDAVAARHLPSVSDDVLLPLARLAWRIIYGGHAHPPQNGPRS